MRRVLPGSIVILMTLAMLAAMPTLAQGRFGKNKVAYESFDWQVYKSPHFDVHYYPSTEPFLEEVVSYAESSYLEISKELDHELRFRVPLVIYKTHGEFRRTNIILSELPVGVAAFAEPIQYRMVLPIDAPADQLYELIAHELTHIFQYSMFFEGYLGRTLRAQVPLWITEGMASYLAQDEDNMDQMVIRDAVVNNILPPIQRLTGLSFLTYRYGHAIFDYIEQQHGKEGLRSFLFEFKKVLLTGNLSRAIKEAFGYDVDEFNRRFNRYLRQKYYPVLLEKKSPDEYGTEIRITRRGGTVFSPALSPSGELITALGVPGQEVDLLVLPAESAEGVNRTRNLTKGWTNRYQELSSVVFEGKRDLSWSPVADQVAVFARKENKWPLLIFNAINGKIERFIDIDDIYELASPTFSPDGSRIAFEGNREGVVDLFELDLESGEIRNLTQDDFYDANPWYATDGRTLLYNRRIGSQWKIFSVDLSDADKKRQLTFGPSSDLQPSYSRDGKTIWFTSDRGEYGVFNVHSLDLTTGDLRQYTDVVGGCFSPVEMAERNGEPFLVYTAFFGGTFRLYRMPIRGPELKVEAQDRMVDVVDVEPFEPDLQLRVDEEQKSPYKLKWDIDAPTISIGVADDGTLLSNGAVQFTDLLGNHRVLVSAASVADFTTINATYINLTKRFNWGGRVFDAQDFFVDRTSGQRVEESNRITGVSAFIQHPISRHLRVEGAVGAQQSRSAILTGINQNNGVAQFDTLKDTLATVSTALVNDTTRYQSFGPFQGRRLRLGVTYGFQLSSDVPAGLATVTPLGSDFEGDLLRYDADIRLYQQLTRRSVIAWRLRGVWNAGDRESYVAFGGINQLRGYEFYDFYGSRIAHMNTELRFPLIDELRFPILRLTQFRGFFFFDAGTAFFQSDEFFYDPDLRNFRVSPFTGQSVPFDIWDSENNRLQDLRASYGVGFHLFFLGGLQFNWVWAKRLDYTGFRLDQTGNFVPLEIDGGGTRSEFYISFDW